MNGNGEKGKRILMFCVSFFGYEKRLADALREAGYRVDLYDERPSNGFVGKVCVRLGLKAYQGVINRRLKKIVEENRDGEYDYVFVVKGEAMDAAQIRLLRQAYPKAQFVLYLWDSVNNIPRGKEKLPLYDRVLTFDPMDAQTYGIPYLPIPYGKEPARQPAQEQCRYDVVFVGTAHSVRPRVVKQIESICRENGRSCYSYFYSPHKLVYLLNKLTNPDYRYLSKGEVHFTPMSARELYALYGASRCVLDIEHPKQKGTTTRPVEMLPLGKKIITTNTYVKDFPFYNENNFCIVDRDDPKFDVAFLDTPYLPVSDELLECYSPRSFVKALLPETED